MSVLCAIIDLYVIVIFARILLDWIRVPWGHPVAKVRDALGVVVDPLLRPLRRIIPPLRLGGVALDLSPLILLIAIEIIAGLICPG